MSENQKYGSLVLKGNSMIRVLMMANDSLLADGIGSLLAQEIDLDVVQMTHQELVKGDDQSVLIVIDEGQPENEPINVTELFRDRPNLLVIMLSLESRNIYIYESYQLVNPDMDQVIHIIREFSRMNLKKKPDEQMLTGTNLSSLKDVSAYFYSCVLHLLGRKSVSNVTLSLKRFSRI
jgi:hypothetical protein